MINASTTRCHTPDCIRQSHGVPYCRPCQARRNGAETRIRIKRKIDPGQSLGLHGFSVEDEVDMQCDTVSPELEARWHAYYRAEGEKLRAIADAKRWRDVERAGLYSREDRTGQPRAVTAVAGKGWSRKSQHQSNY